MKGSKLPLNKHHSRLQRRKAELTHAYGRTVNIYTADILSEAGLSWFMVDRPDTIQPRRYHLLEDVEPQLAHW